MQTKGDIKRFIEGLTRDELLAFRHFLRERSIIHMEQARRHGLLEFVDENEKSIDIELELEPRIELPEEVEMRLLEFIYNVSDEELAEVLSHLVEHGIDEI